MEKKMDDGKVGIPDMTQNMREDSPQPEYCDCQWFHTGECHGREIDRLRVRIKTLEERIRKILRLIYRSMASATEACEIAQEE
jgi:hypothetical protein